MANANSKVTEVSVLNGEEIFSDATRMAESLSFLFEKGILNSEDVEREILVGRIKSYVGANLKIGAKI